MYRLNVPIQNNKQIYCIFLVHLNQLRKDQVNNFLHKFSGSVLVSTALFDLKTGGGLFNLLLWLAGVFGNIFCIICTGASVCIV